MSNRLSTPIIFTPPWTGGLLFFEPGLELGGGHVDEFVELPVRWYLLAHDSEREWCEARDDVMIGMMMGVYFRVGRSGAEIMGKAGSVSCWAFGGWKYHMRSKKYALDYCFVVFDHRDACMLSNYVSVWLWVGLKWWVPGVETLSRIVFWDYLLRC